MNKDADAASRPADGDGDDTALTLVPPEPPPPVENDRAVEMVKLDPQVASQLERTAGAYVDELAALDPHSQEFGAKVDAIHALGVDDIRQAAEVSNRLLKLPVSAMEKGGLSGSGPVAKSLTDLRKTVENLDPKSYDLFSPHKVLGLIPFGNAVRDYFRKYSSAQSHLNAIIQSLESGQDVLRHDVGAVEEEKTALWAVMQRLRQYVVMVRKLDDLLSAQVASLQATDPERAKSLNEEVLFYVRQKEQDLLTQLAVSVQAYLALDVVKKNDLELIKGVDRATTTTVSALRTAVIVAQALANEKLVLDQVRALNTTTGNLIESTSQMLKQQTGEVYEQAAGATIEVEKLKAAFANIYAAIDSIDAYKQQALVTMKQTAEVLAGEVARSQEYLGKAQAKADRALPQEGAQLRLPETPPSTSS